MAENPFTPMLASFQPDRFFGRNNELALILPGISASEPRSFSLVGIRTIGKTSLLNYLAHPDGALKKNEEYLGNEFQPGGSSRFHFCYINFHNFSEEDYFFRSLLQRLISELDKRILSQISINPTDQNSSKQQIVDGLRYLLEELWQQKIRVVFLIDDFDPVLRIIDSEDDTLLRSLMAFASFIFVTEEPMPEIRPELSVVSPLLNVLHSRVLGLLNKEDARALVIDPTVDLSLKFSEEVADFLMECVGRQPYILSLACEFFWDLSQSFENILDRIKDERFRQQFLLTMGGKPQIIETFSIFWNKLSSLEEREMVFHIYTGKDIDFAQKRIIQKLENRSLIYTDFLQGDYHLFSQLFEDYIYRLYENWNESRHDLLPSEIEELANNMPQIDRQLLTYFLKNPNKLCTFNELMKEVWGNANISKRALEASVARVRKSLEMVDKSGWNYIKNIWGKGYQYTPRDK